MKLSDDVRMSEPFFLRNGGIRLILGLWAFVGVGVCFGSATSMSQVHWSFYGLLLAAALLCLVGWRFTAHAIADLIMACTVKE